LNLGRLERIHTYSPLRYPGGKTRLLAFFRRLIRENGLRNATYVEPYAGGAGAALALLISGQVDQIVINDLDPAISSFWRSVVENHEEFSARVREVRPTIDEWLKQRDIHRNSSDNDTMALGFATFFLNRTSRSGVLGGGPIGGLDQSGADKIDARFNKEALLERIRLVGLYRSRILVTDEDGVDVVARYVQYPGTLVYADPPYYAKGSSLYLNSFSKEDHVRLANCLNAAAAGRWVLTYDDVPQIDQLYSARRSIRYSLYYSAHTAKTATELMIFADSLIAPDSDFAWSQLKFTTS
jgi:DNA adenine methylase